MVDELLADYDANAGADGAMAGASSGGIQISSPILLAFVTTNLRYLQSCSVRGKPITKVSWSRLLRSPRWMNMVISLVAQGPLSKMARTSGLAVAG